MSVIKYIVSCFPEDYHNSILYYLLEDKAAGED